MQVESLNELDPVAAAAELRRCCGCRRWVDEMLRRRPFADSQALLTAAEDSWWQLQPEDWLEAFSCHPKIGDTAAGVRQKFAGTAQWSHGEQAGVTAASEETLQALTELNRDYEKKFGYIFIVCASGKTAAEMLALLRERIGNPPDKELRIAAAEQSKITAIRLEKLCREARSQPMC